MLPNFGSDVRAFIEGNTNFYLSRAKTPKHIKEQILYRMLKCAPCTLSEKKKCKYCSCPTPQVFFAPHKQDPKGNWEPKFLSPEDWAATKAALDPSLLTLIRQYPQVLSIYRSLWHKGQK